MPDDLSEECWTILNLAPGAEISEIHRAFEQLRLSCLPKDRDRAAPLSDNTKKRLQQLDRAFFLALDSKKTRAFLTNTTLTDHLESTFPVTQQSAFDSSAKKTVETRAHTEKSNRNLATAARTARFCTICKAPIKSWLATSFCPQCQPAPLSSKNTSEQNHSIASDDLVSPQERSRSVGGLTASFVSRVLAIARGLTTRMGTTFSSIQRIFERFSRFHIAVRAFLGGTLALAMAWLFSTLSGHSVLSSNTAGNAIFAGVMFGILTKYRWWLLGLVLLFLYERYFH